jgi:lantibiotic biosynthesis protein
MPVGVIRAPLLPIETYPREAPRQLPADPLARAALAVGAAGIVDAWERDGATDRLRRKLLRYSIRMATRPTPFGLFAGVGLVEWADHTDVALAAVPARTRTRPDMGWLLDLVQTLERDPAIRRQLRLFTNPLAFVKNDHVFLRDGATIPSNPLPVPPDVQRILEMSRSPRPYADIRAGLDGTPELLLDRLFERSLLLSDLRPPLTENDPARYVCERLRGVVGTSGVESSLEALLDALTAWDESKLEERCVRWTAVTQRALGVHQPDSSAPALQVDAAVRLEGRQVHRAVAREAARAAELLLRLSPLPDGLPALNEYRERFARRYGDGREMPILELLDPDVGLGPLATTAAANARNAARWSHRDQALWTLALEAFRDHRHGVELDAATLARLETCRPRAATVPDSLEICVSVLAKSAADVDAGAFAVIVGPSLGAEPAGAHLARFADVIGPSVREALGQVPRLAPTTELVHLPIPARAANVAVRPRIVESEIVCGTTPSRPASAIPLKEVVVGLHEDRLYARWIRQKTELAVTIHSMLARESAPAPFQLLEGIGLQGRPVLSAFDWGPAAQLPSLPRVTYGKAVLSPARWRLDSLDGTPRFRQVFDAWRRDADVPRFVYLTHADHRLLLDLDEPSHVELLREELTGHPDVSEKVVEEALPGREHAWIESPQGRHAAEFVVMLGRREPRSRALIGRRSSAIARDARLRPPGSDWLYLKLYYPAPLQDEFIAGEALVFADFVCAAGLAESWFFVRYADPEPHVRLRFHGEPGTLAGRLLPQAIAWGQRLMRDTLCDRFTFDTYEREIERYGGEAAIEIAEAVFAADSYASAQIISLLPRLDTVDRTAVGVLTYNVLLGALHACPSGRLNWCRAHLARGRRYGAVYRTRGPELRDLLAHGPGNDLGGKALATVVNRLRRSLEPLGAELRGLVPQPEFDRVCASLLHMHANRLLGPDSEGERQVAELAARSRLAIETDSSSAELDRGWAG